MTTKNMADADLPAGNGQWQAVRAPWKRLITGRQDVEHALRRWHALDPILVSTPTSPTFLPPLCVPELADAVHRGMLGRQRAVLAITGIMTVLALVAWQAGFDDGKFGPVVAAFALIFAYLFADYHFVLRHRDRTADRTVFIYRAYRKGGAFAAIAGGVLAAAGLAQLFLQDRLGGLVPMVNAYGALFVPLAAGEWWRYLVGPFVHGGAIHWIGNLAMLVVAAGLAGTMGRIGALSLLFVAINVGSVLAVQYLGIGHTPDALLGVSGGIFGLFGWVVGVTFRERARFPWMWFATLSFVFLNIGLAWILVRQTSNVAHGFGLATGLLSGLVRLGRRADPASGK